MITTSPALAAAITARVRTTTARVNIDWGNFTSFDTTRLATEISIDRNVDDAPNELGLVTGGTRAGATIKLTGSYVTDNGILVNATDLSPYRTVPWSLRNVPGYGVGLPVSIDFGFDIGGGVFEWVRAFTGFVSNIAPSATEGGVDILCIDKADRLRADLTLPTIGNAPYTGTAAGETSVNPLGLIELALRSGGYYQYPALKPGVVLATSNCGSNVPEVGNYGAPLAFLTADVPGFAFPRCRNAGQLISNEPLLANSGEFVRAQCKVQRDWPTSIVPYQYFIITSFDNVEVLVVDVTQTGVINVRNSASGTIVFSTPAGAAPNNVPFYLGVTLRIGTGGQVWVRVNNTTYTSGVVNVRPFVGNDGNKVRMRWNSIALEGFQLWKPPTFTNPATEWDDAFVPNYVAHFDDTGNRIRAIGPQGGKVDAWGLIQELASAELGVAMWDEAGEFWYMSNATWQTKRWAASNRILTDEPLLALGFAWGTEGSRRSVKTEVVVPVTVNSTLAAPAWAADDVYECPSVSTVTIQIQTDTPVYDLPLPLNQFADSPNACFFQACYSSAVGDPAAVNLPGVTVKLRPVDGGIELTIGNPYGSPISLYTAGNGGSIPAGPYLIVHGKRITFPAARTITVQANPDSINSDDLVLAANQWRQNEDRARAYLAGLANDVKLPAIVFDTLPIQADPRLQLGDVVTPDDTTQGPVDDRMPNGGRLFDTPQPCLIVGVQHQYAAGQLFRTNLNLRACYPPTGWVLGVAARSQLGTTTTLVS